MRLSVLDQSPISEGSTGAQALRNSIDLAQHADSLGFHRYWVAEHHGGPMLAGAGPEALIGPIAAATGEIRVGSGGGSRPHYAPPAACLGFHRYWVAGHHGGPMPAGAGPGALIGPIAAATGEIRVGSGGVMLPHYSPLKVAETFTVLAGLFPGRIDLGLGRASG